MLSLGTFIATSILANAAPRQVPPEYSGVWMSSTGKIFATLVSHPSQIRLGDFDYDVDSLAEVPAGGYYGQWVKARFLVAVGQRRTPQDPKDRITWQVNSGHPDEVGEVRLSFFGPPSPSASRNLTLDLVAKNVSYRLSEKFYWGFGFKSVSFEGLHQAPHFQLNLEEQGNGMDYEGELTYNKATYVFHGYRSGLRLAFSLNNPETNAVAGVGYIVWTPSKDRFYKIKDSGRMPTDSMAMYLKLPGFFPNGMVIQLDEPKR